MCTCVWGENGRIKFEEAQRKKDALGPKDGVKGDGGGGGGGHNKRVKKEEPEVAGAGSQGTQAVHVTAADKSARGHGSGQAMGQDEGGMGEEEADRQGGGEAAAQNGTSEVKVDGAAAATTPMGSVSKRRGGPRFERPKRGAERQVATEAVGAEGEEQSIGPAPEC